MVRVCRTLAALAVLLAWSPARAAEFPLAGSKISIKDASSPSGRKVVIAGRFSGDLGNLDANFAGSTLRVTGGPGEGDTGLIRLGPNWGTLPKGKGIAYEDETQAAGGVKSIVVRKGKKGGGRLKIVGGAANWPYEVKGPQTVVTVSLTIAEAKLCAQFTSPKTKTRSRRVSGKAPKALAACPCETFDSTWGAIQKVIFERHGCTDQTCHGAPGNADQNGGLDLRPESAFENLVNVFSEKGQMDRVEPGSPTNDSFLYRKLAAKTLGLAGVPGTAMPQGLPAVSADELEALRLWIQYSGKKDGVVAGTQELLNSCLPPVKPPTLTPPDPPAAGAGVQYYAHPWTIAPQGEDEGCYATYYDVTAQVPDEFKVDCPTFWGGTPLGCYAFNKTELTQEPNSHHSIIHIYKGDYGIDKPGFDHYCRTPASNPNRDQPCNPANPGQPAPDGDDCGAGGTCVAGFNFRCGGTAAGAPCDPRIPDVCGGGVKCLGVFKSSLACLTFGPPDYASIGSVVGNGSTNSPSVGGSQQPFSRTDFPDDVYGVYPLKAVWVWNSHAFNLTDESTENRQWLNVYFAPQDEQEYLIEGIFDSDDIFVQRVPPFEEREYCRTATFPTGTRIFELSSHTHSRARLFRIWGPSRNENGDQVNVSIQPRCRSTINNPGACLPEPGPAIGVTTQYNDPTQIRFTPPLELDDPDPTKRTVKFCAIYDNGFNDPQEVKRNSTSPLPPSFGAFAPGGPCLLPGANGRDLGIACLSGPNKGKPCEGDADGFQADDRKCDGPGYTAPDGTCDACPLRGGVTTQDEMYIMLGNHYCEYTAPGAECVYGICSGGANWGQPCDDNPVTDECPGGSCQEYIN